MSAPSYMADPLTVLPPEIVLRVVEFLPVSAVASLTAVSKPWHQFIDITHREAIYSSETKTAQPPGGARDFSFLSNSTTSFTKLFENTTSWKDLCKRQKLLARNWADERPVTRESVLQVGNNPVWRFRADFKRRFFISTSHAGGLNVTDMDTGRILWRLPSTLERDEGSVRPYAHLEYQDGMAVFDREGDALEVWQADQEGAKRGEFRRIAILDHNCQTRGFQLSYWTLCVVSTQGQGFVYDMTQRPPKLTTHISIENDAVGHLDQSADAVIYSMGPRGYHVYNKATGEFLGALQPSRCTDMYHILPPVATSPSAIAALAAAARHGPTQQMVALSKPRKDCLVPIELSKGPLPPPTDFEHVRHGDDEWGAGMLHGDLFVGFSRAGRVFVCSNWRKALQNERAISEHGSLIECESDGSNFDLGGWLSVRNHRVMFEIQDRIYVVALDDENKIQDVNKPARASYSLLTSSVPQLAVPVSFMALYDDAIMTTYTTLGFRQHNSDVPDDEQDEGPARIFPTKAIRIVSLAPDLSDGKSVPIDDQQATGDGLWSSEPRQRRAEDTWRSQAGLLQLVSLLGDELDDEDEAEMEALAMENEEEWEDLDDDNLEGHDNDHDHEGDEDSEPESTREHGTA
ncbi:hypothetical protein AnigIFM60653_003468 [Aspergillus niger]|uniref:F-box domain-containing protein n=1 Tax=Aspergillus welwitschiae TaxID=1341132 RepID=A0A3F3Q963_9EURO|nr:hypothetical protein BDQ94DRAFT_125247 [Aspergillus welwitschiae]RDH35764.1 hypothetical protein BDQ94DRAFT_125247 [Aspergillus welwitschiae]GKZ68534.1 hypothetical protein AnigIFM50267_003244 [Aspergillus niger]GKZ99261.1 hypothetical protein AnigIFM60653_003468 [Aspergillus niger]GLA17949.1 hypothetical protein AnigIFM62618_005102 [Aspergillus niger]